MDKRKQQLLELDSYIEKVDNDLCLALQSLQWDRNKVMQGIDSVICVHNKNHRIPASKKEEHEKECLLRTLGYTADDKMLPEPAYPQSKSCVHLHKHDIEAIIENASKDDPLFKKGLQSNKTEPLTVERMQSTYTTDDRRAIYDAVVANAPILYDGDFITPRLDDTQSSKQECRQKTYLELLAEQRDMKRRRQKYRVTTKHKNYSQVLREVIHNQMELFHETQQHSKESLQSNHNTKNDTRKRRLSRDGSDVTRHKERRGEGSRESSRHRRHEKRGKKHTLERSDKERHKSRNKYNDRDDSSYNEKARDRDKYYEKGKTDYKDKRYKNERKERETRRDYYEDRDKAYNKERSVRERRDDHSSNSKYENRTDYKYKKSRGEKDRSHYNKY